MPARGRLSKVGLSLLMLTFGSLFVGGAAETTFASSTPHVCRVFHTDPAWSPDGSKVAYARQDEPGPSELWLMSADGSDQKRLLALPSSIEHPTWSPDGARIAFGTGCACHIYVVNADGSGLTTLGPGTEPAWSPTGDKIAFTKSVSDREIFLMNPGGSGLRQLTNNQGDDFDPAWSPDGSKIAFASIRGEGQPSIYVMNADGSGVRKLTSASVIEESPVWSPDGSKIAYRANVPGSGHSLYVADADGNNVRRLLPPGFDGDMPSWSKDGRIAFSGEPPTGSEFRWIWVDIYSVDPGGSDIRNLTLTNGVTINELELVSSATGIRPVRPGRRLAATLTVADKKDVALQLDYPSCRAFVRGRRLSVVDRGFVKSRLRCVWLVPRWAKGKLVRGTVGVESCGSKLEWAFKRRVR